MTNQTLFNRVWKRLVDEFDKGQSTFLRPGSYSPSCRYEAPDGNHCAIGAAVGKKALIELKKYEGKDIVSAIKSNNYLSKYFKGVDTCLADSLQIVHDNLDNWTSVENMKEVLRKKAAIYNVNVPKEKTK